MQDLFDRRHPEAEGGPHLGDVCGTTAPLIPCDAVNAFNFVRKGPDLYCLTLPAPGFDEDEISVSAEGGYLRVTGLSRRVEPEGDVLHRGIDEKLDYTFLMTHPLDVARVEARCGLLRIMLRDQPGAGVHSVIVPRLHGVEAFAVAA